nr:hypothetical protein [Tanacetum cinerariifolium]
MVWSGYVVLMFGKTDSIKINNNLGCLPVVVAQPEASSLPNHHLLVPPECNIRDLISEGDELGEEDNEDDESSDADDERKGQDLDDEGQDLDDEGRGLDDEGQGLNDEGQSLKDEGPGMEEEEAAGQHQAISVIDTAMSEPLGLGYGAAKSLALESIEEISPSTYEEVVLFYNGLDVPTRQILDSRGAIPSNTAADVKVAIQEMA